jgi:exodeoxyribonuclease VII small subunit
METANLTYEQAMNELRTISAEIDSEKVSVDELAQKFQRASYLIQFCQQKLRASEMEVNNIITQMQSNQ